MDDQFIKKIIQNLKKDLYITESDDFIGDLFEQRTEDIDSAIINNKEYAKYLKRNIEITNEMINKLGNSNEVKSLLEEYLHITSKSNDLCEKIMYKYGILDGMLLVLEGTKPIDITKFLKNNKV